MIALQPHADGVILPVQARAGASSNKLAGEHDGQLRVQVTTAPEKGKANAAILALLSKALKIPKSRLAVVSGATSPKKRILVLGAEAESLRTALEQLLEKR